MNPQEKALIESARLGDIDGVKAALAAGARASNGAALYWAATQGHAEILSRLLAAGANVHANRDAALRCAAARGHAEIARCLMAAFADPVIALKSALKSNRNDVVAMLDACAAVLTSAQRAALLAVAHPDEFVQLRAIAASTEKQRAIRR
ncbi:ankyrin repeat domain-containing protein [Metallibacterium scheffleri]|uniref:ankyrin repeat domain-containing protein n=1 Tax=Metallibacterium scheffleri TaxID=993689 RepID=UPI0023EF6EB2|nr:ankyrin repeat domain-containing protein [Metallibacterium scheffleri]